MHWKMVQGCIGSVKNSGEVNLAPNLYETILSSWFLDQGIHFRLQNLSRGYF